MGMITGSFWTAWNRSRNGSKAHACSTQEIRTHLAKWRRWWRSSPRIIATRFHAHRGKETYLDSLTSPEVRRIWEKALDLNLIIELHIGPDHAQGAAEMLRDYPESTVLIDHLAEPHMGDAVEYAGVLDLADFDTAYMKLSGLNHFATDAPLYLGARPFTRRVIEAFGPDQMVWGSGTPEIVDAHLSEYTEADRRKVKGDNLARLLGWD